MRTIKNLTPESYERDDSTGSNWDEEASYYRCRNCGAPDDICAYYVERTYGVANVMGIDGELDDFDSNDSDGFEVSSYRCRNCDAESSHLPDIIAEPNYRPTATRPERTRHERHRQRR